MVKRRDIMKDAASKHRKLFKKRRKSKKYVELYKKLWKSFEQQDLRDTGLTSIGRRHGYRDFYFREITASDEYVIRSHVIVRFLRQYNIRMRSRQQNKKN